MTIYDIKRCPFCGNEATIDKYSQDLKNPFCADRDYFIVTCKKCFSSSPKVLIDNFNTFCKVSYTELRNNNLIRIREEESYEKYKEELMEKTVKLWNNRI